MFLLNSKKQEIAQRIRPLIAAIAEDWPAKVISIALAIVLFVFHRMGLLEERFFSVPLTVETDNALVAAGPYPGMIRITLRGDANSIYPIIEDDIHAYINFEKYTRPGTYRAPVQIHKKGTALRAETLEISVDPLEVVLVLDERVRKTVPVKVRFRGALEPGYEMGETMLNPAHVDIEGPRGLLANVRELSTEFIELSGRSGDFSATVRLVNPEPLLIIRGNGLIEFHGAVQEQLRVQNFEDLPIRIDNLDDQFSGELEIDRGSVRIEGGENIFDKLQEQDVSLSVDCSSIDSTGEFLLPVSALFPVMFTLIRQDPETVMIRIQRRDTGDGES
jgi:YbbR domain-containing protein